jgi:hypothetical protein
MAAQMALSGRLLKGTMMGPRALERAGPVAPSQRRATMRTKDSAPLPVFYMVQVAPEAHPRRIKLGWSAYAGERLGQHRQVWPKAELLATWPCHRSHELNAIRATTAHGCRQLAREVFDCRDLEWTRAVADAFFLGLSLALPSCVSLMPPTTLRRGYVRQQASGRWVGQVRLGREIDGTHRRGLITADTEAEAREKLAQLIARFS